MTDFEPEGIDLAEEIAELRAEAGAEAAAGVDRAKTGVDGTDPGAAEDAAAAVGAAPACPPAPVGPRWKRVLKRTLVTVAAIIVGVVVLGVLLYNFGGMGGTAYPETKAQFEQMVATGQVSALPHRFVIPIPGCTCHSKDPVQTAKHRTYRMSECVRCHATKPAVDVPVY